MLYPNVSVFGAGSADFVKALVAGTALLSSDVAKDEMSKVAKLKNFARGTVGHLTKKAKHAAAQALPRRARLDCHSRRQSSIKGKTELAVVGGYHSIRHQSPKTHPPDSA